MMDLFAVLWIAFAAIVLVATRANRYLVLVTIGSIVLACYFAAGVWMNVALSIALDDRSARQHLRTTSIFEVLTVAAMTATTACLVLAWQRRPRGDARDRRPSVAPSAS